MKYSKGDKVKIKSKVWYEQMLSIPEKNVWRNKLTDEFAGIWCGSKVFYVDMCKFCSEVMTIQEIGIDHYIMEEDSCGYEFTDEMIEDINATDSLMEKNNILPVADPLYAYDNIVELNDGRSGLVDTSWWDDDEKCYMYIVSIGRGDCDVFKESELKMSGDNSKFHIGDRITDGKNHLIITKVLSDRYIVVDRLDEMGELYFSSQDNWHYDTGWMYDGKLVAERFSDDKGVPKFKVGDKICMVCGLSNGYLVTSVSDEYYGLQMGEGNVGVLPVAEQDEWVLLSAGDKKIEGLVEEANKLDADAFSDGYDQGYEDGQHDMNEWKLPDGFEFRDENGNVINAKKIVLEKKKSKYPQSFEECCEVLSMPSYYKLRYSTYEHGYHEYTTSKDLGVLQSELDTLGKLLICRDAYWLTAGREMGLEGKWKPDWSDCRKFAIVVEGNEILTDVCLRRNRILVFPTEEMRDEFLKVFRNYIEVCKEFL